VWKLERGKREGGKIDEKTRLQYLFPRLNDSLHDSRWIQEISNKICSTDSVAALQESMAPSMVRQLQAREHELYVGARKRTICPISFSEISLSTLFWLFGAVASQKFRCHERLN
jgi:hypothetical protein